MKGEDWYCHSTWTADDREDFYAHLGRARSYNRLQDLHIQATYLNGVGSGEAVAGALELLELLVRQYPSPSQLESAHLLKAMGLESLDRLDDATDAHRLAS